jgi:nitrogen fixation protein NifU and related proteins
VEIDELYQEIILDHYKRPRHARKIPDAEAMVDDENPTCGDRIKLNAAVDGETVRRIEIDCAGCAICSASASMMAEKLEGRPVAEARRWIHDFTELMRGAAELDDDALGDLVALRGVRRYPLRVKCATMAWHALGAVLDKVAGGARLPAKPAGE